MKHLSYSASIFYGVSAVDGMKPNGNVAGTQVSNGEWFPVDQRIYWNHIQNMT
ncbi:MAG: hypothetical protein KAG53_00900 [Endozoicomonadaceae bacterium]|nr:hypothetical protein [Endozoicomonadaceae bacterium]